MKKGILVPIIIIAAVILLLGGWIISARNGLVTEEENVTEANSAIATQLQRRADLIPNFVSSVKGYTEYEQSTLQAVTEARASVSKAGSVSEQSAAEGQLDRAIDVWVNAVTEAYPELKASAQFTALQDELSGTENRITKARNNYNAAAKIYNVKIRKFPDSVIAGIFGFDKVDYFEAAEGTEKVPQVDFS